MICSVSWAGWEITDSDSDGKFTAYHDKSTIRKNGSIVKMWSLMNYSAIQNIKSLGKFKSAKGLTAYNCKSEERATISLNYYSDSMGGGEVVFSVTLKENQWSWKPIVPESIVESEWKIACEKK